MANIDFQRHSFLGGEVSPCLYERSDMEKFGRWFSKAENIRFGETGAFRSRPGFVKIADTKYNQEGQIIKLLSFSFNDAESFLVELGPGYVRFYRNGSPVIVDDDIYELSSPMTSFDEEDIKFAQSGDTVFITHPTYGIFELARLKSDGTEWELKRFSADILPMKEMNDDKNKTLSSAAYSSTMKYISIYNPDSQFYLNVSFIFDGNEVYTADSATRDELVAGITEAVGAGYVVTVSGDDVYINNDSIAMPIPNFSLTFTTSYFQNVSSTSTVNDYTTSTATASCSGWDYLDTVSFYAETYTKQIVNGRPKDVARKFSSSVSVASATIDESILLAQGNGAFGPVDILPSLGNANAWRSYGATVDAQNHTISYNTFTYNKNLVPITPTSSGYRTNSTITLYGRKAATGSYSYSSQNASSTKPNVYVITASSDSIFDKVSVDDCILVKHAVDSQSLNGNYGVGTHALGPVKSNGEWRAYNLGNWAGKVQIQYSTDNQVTWVDYYSWTSESDSQPYNNSTSGTLITNDLVWFRVVLTVTTGTIRFFFTANSFEVNSYYKVLFKNDTTHIVAECIKNDVGTFASNSNYRLPAFSNLEGWPQSIAFYQNRLFFGKDYVIYGSRSNDFWDFYEPIKLQADDPVTMSLLSQKINTIRNLVTQRSFFAFTAGGEFGIGSEGALTQNDKYLKPFSANGSAYCMPVLISDVVLFVDKSFKAVRALKYSLEADGYEAPDITMTMSSLMEGERIISTDTIFEEKEALFLSDTGTIWALKYITDQNVLSWSHWKHAFGKITNICVVPNGAKHDLYIAVEANGKKWIEKMDKSEFADTTEYFEATSDPKVTVTGVPGDKKAIIQGDRRTFVTIDENNQIDTPDDTTQGFKVGSVYVSIATLLSPTVQMSDYHQSNYEVKRPFKVFFYYLNSLGFKVGVEENEKMPVEWQPINADVDDELELTSGKKSVLIPSRFEGTARVSFMQDEPFPMEIADVLIQTDFGGK